MNVDVAIIGAGPCGLGAAWQLEQMRSQGLARHYVLIEQNARSGGSAASVTTAEGFTFDLGGHVLYIHEHYANLRKLLEDSISDWHESIPVRGVFTDRRLIPYPIQRNIHRLPTNKMISSLLGLGKVKLYGAIARRQRHVSRIGTDLESHLRERFGTALTRSVLGPINSKMWAYEPRLLDSSWTRERSGSSVQNVADISIRQVLRSIITRRDNPGWTSSTRVRYPASGGTGSMWTAVARGIPSHRIVNGRRVTKIDSSAKVIILSDGTHVRYSHLISTMPLDDLLRLLSDRPGLAARAGELRYSRAFLNGFGVLGAPPPWLDGVQSFHVTQEDIPCWRITFPAAFAPGNVPVPGSWSLLCETSFQANVGPWDTSSIASTIEKKLGEYGVIPKESTVISRWETALEHGYPVPFRGRDSVLQQLQGSLKEIGITSRGRFGGWKYEVSNQDHTFMQGVEAVNAIVSNETESTYRFDDDGNQ